MISYTTAKILLRISSTDYDTLIPYLLPIVYNDIITLTNNKFLAAEYELTDDAFYFDNTAAVNKIFLAAGGISVIGFPVGGNLVVADSRLNDGVYTIAAVADTYIQVSETLADEVQTTEGYEVTISLARFPKQTDMVAARMIGYLIQHSASSGLTNMSQGGYSETLGRMEYGYPAEITDQLRQYKCISTGRGTIHYHVNENRKVFSEVISNQGDE